MPRAKKGWKPLVYYGFWLTLLLPHETRSLPFCCIYHKMKSKTFSRESWELSKFQKFAQTNFFFPDTKQNISNQQFLFMGKTNIFLSQEKRAKLWMSICKVTSRSWPFSIVPDQWFSTRVESAPFGALESSRGATKYLSLTSFCWLNCS